MFGAISTSTTPGPIPVAPLRIVIHETLLAAAQPHPDCAATAKRWLPPVAAIVAALGVMSKLQTGTGDGVGAGGVGVGAGVGAGAGGVGSTSAASWVSVTVAPAMVKLPLRPGPSLTVTATVTSPAPTPDAPDSMRIHSASLTALQLQPASVATLNVPVVDAAATTRVGGVTSKRQAAAACCNDARELLTITSA